MTESTAGDEIPGGRHTVEAKGSSGNCAVPTSPTPTGFVVINEADLLGTGDICSEPIQLLAVVNDFAAAHVNTDDGNGTGDKGIQSSIAANKRKDETQEASTELSPKKTKPSENCDTEEKKISLTSIQEEVLKRLFSIGKKLENVNTRCHYLEEKVDNLISQVKDGALNSRITFSSGKGRSGAIIVGVPPQNCQTGSSSNDASGSSVGSSVQLITLNCESDYPNGSWLGDPENPAMRVRCHIVPSDLEAINKSCGSAEKVALTLLDYLFDREMQACSNLSGTGKHGKKQLDPLKVYGIKCHLMYKFGITEKDWHRIKLNLDSKCRTAFRRKQKGMPLTVKAFRDRLPATYLQMMSDSSPLSPISGVTEHDQDLQSAGEECEDLNMDQDIELTHIVPVPLQQADTSTVTIPFPQVTGSSQIIHTERGDIQVVHATPEQIAQIQQCHQVQILTSAEVFNELQSQVSQDSVAEDQS